MLTFKPSLLRITAGAAALSAAIGAQAQPADVKNSATEEVIVTGTFIRRSEGFTPASPVQEIGKEEFEAHAPKTVADFLTTLPYSFNTHVHGGTRAGLFERLRQPQSAQPRRRRHSRAAQLAARGARRGHRQQRRRQCTVPQIAIERIDILKDGASSLYGSDAVGGVANFITRSNFDGFEVQAQGDMREYGSTTDYRVSGIWGARPRRPSIVVSFGVLQSCAVSLGILRNHPRPPRHRRRIPPCGLAGALLHAKPQRRGCARRRGDAHIADPLVRAVRAVGQHPGQSRDTAGRHVSDHLPAERSAGHECERRREPLSGVRRVHHEFNPSASASSARSGFLRTRTAIADTPGAAVNPGPGQPTVIIPGYAPSNTFRALNAAGQPLYAQSSGVQLGYDKDGNGINDFLPARATNGQVIVVGTDPNVGANGLPVIRSGKT